MSIKDRVFTVLKNKPGTPHSIRGVADALPECTYEQVANSLSDLALFDERVTRRSRGVYLYGELDEVALDIANGMTTPNGVVAVHGSDETEENVVDELRTDEHMYFTQVGVAENGDLILSRDSDTRIYRATPV